MTKEKSVHQKLSQNQIDLENQSFYSIPQGKLFEGFRLCRDNARQLFSGADTIATNNPGLANSLLILCAEECVKCFVLFAVCAAIPVPFLIKPIFSKHTAKHVTGKELHEVVRITSNVLGLFAPKGKGKSLLALALDIAGVSGSDEVRWWDSANEMKNKGLYIDYQNGQFHSPADIGSDSFDAGRMIVARFITILEKTEFLKSRDFKLLRD